MNPYGHISFWRIDVHYVTLLCMIILYVVYYRRINYDGVLWRRNKLMCLFLPFLYCLGAAMHYEIYWNIGWMMSWKIVILEVIGFCVCLWVIHMAIGDMKNKFKYDIPQIDFNRWVWVSCYFFITICWLATTDFYLVYKQVVQNLTIEDPHNFIWAVGKVGTLLWVGVAPRRGEK